MKISALGETGAASRTQLTRQRVVAAAVELADSDGTESISMRRLAQELGVEAMSLYTHVRNKDDLLDGMADAVISQIPLSADGAGWKAALRQMALAAREVMLRHPWAPRVVETRTAPGPAALGYINAVIGTLREPAHADRLGAIAVRELDGSRNHPLPRQLSAACRPCLAQRRDFHVTSLTCGRVLSPRRIFLDFLTLYC